jgi:hypothetical protein
VLRTRRSGVRDAAHFVILPVLTAAIFLPLQRQRLMVQQFYTEVGALEEVLEEAAYALGDEAYSVLNQVSKYIDQVGKHVADSRHALVCADAAPCVRHAQTQHKATQDVYHCLMPRQHQAPISSAQLPSEYRSCSIWTLARTAA